MASAPAKNSANISQVNQFLRQRLLATGIQENISLGSYNLTPGNTTRIKLQNIGLLTRIRLLVTFSYTPSVTIALSKFGLLNAITNISVNDFTGTPRINASASAIQMRNDMRYRRKQGAHKPGLAGIGSTEANGTSALVMPNAGLTAAAQTAQFQIDLPIAVDPIGGDLRGAIPMQSNVGEIYLNITMAALLNAASDDTKAFVTAATMGTVTGTVQVLQEFILPQVDNVSSNAFGAQYAYPIPPLDTNLINELVTIQTSDNIAVGTEKLIPYPNTRAMLGCYYRWFNNSIQGGASPTFAGGDDISQHRLILNGATPIQTYPSAGWMYINNRDDLGFDFGVGAFAWDHVGLPGSGQQPIQTAQLGNVQIGITPGSNNGGNTFVEFTTESLFNIGTSLGSIAPGA